MSGSRYQYDKVNAVKVILISKNDKVLLIKEPDTNDWMPGHWGLPGGKTLEKESLIQAYKRKAKDDLGVSIEPIGIFRIEELLMGEKTAMMYHVVAYVEKEFVPQGEIAGYKWVGAEEVEKLDLVEFTEFFNKRLLLDFLRGGRELINFSFIDTLDYYNKEKNDLDYIRWFKSGKRK